MFKGLHTGLAQGDMSDLEMVDNAGLPFYGDNENPYVHIKLYPTDNWEDVLTAYVRKNATPQIMEALRGRSSLDDYVRSAV
jgi:hypothetical protein